MSIRIVRLCEDMAPEIHKLEKMCFFDPYCIESLINDFSNERNICFAVVNDTDVLGYCLCSSVLDEAELMRIAVNPSFRQNGIGSLMLNYITEQCIGLKISHIYLEVRENNIPARKLYEKHKFIQTGVRKNYYRDNGENAVLYTLSVCGW